MDATFWVLVALTLMVGVGMLLVARGEPRLKARAKELGMWSDRKDEPGPIPGWSIWPMWTVTAYKDLFRRSEQRDPNYRRYQNRVRVGAVLSTLGFAGVFLIALLSEK